MLVVIIIDALPPHFARMGMGSVPRLNYRLLPGFVYAKTRTEKRSSTTNKVKERVSITVLRVPVKLSEFELATLQ